jgi:hypothetical protein
VAPDRQLHDRPSVGVIAQQYSTATFIRLRFHSGKAKFNAFQKSHYFILSLNLKFE